MNRSPMCDDSVRAEALAQRRNEDNSAASHSDDDENGANETKNSLCFARDSALSLVISRFFLSNLYPAIATWLATRQRADFDRSPFT